LIIKIPTKSKINEIWEKVVDLLSDIDLNTKTLSDEGINYQYLLKIEFKAVSTIVPLYNNWEYTKQFLSSIEDSKIYQDELILIDNK